MDSFTKTMELVGRAQQGDAAALDRICARYYDRIRIPVRLKLGPGLRRRLETNDVLQEVFCHLVKGIQRFEWRDEGSLLRYLTKMAVHEICAQADRWFNLKRNPNREQPLELRGADGETAGEIRALAPDSAPMMEKLVRSEQSEALEECLGLLSEDHREVVLLRDFLGMSWQQIQEELGLNTASAARERRREALVRLSRFMRERGLHEEEE